MTITMSDPSRTLSRTLSPPNSTLSKEIGRLVYQARTQRRLSQQQLAEASGFTHSFISKIESGARAPSIEALTQILAAMNLQLRIEETPDEADG
jgi:transcriptional regulator with XRE-family HTH domain